MHYQEQLDALFGNGISWQHRTMRTVFDPYSSEYNQTSIDEKIAILKAINNSEIELSDLISAYKKFYREENKLHVVKSLEDGLVVLLTNVHE